MTAFFSITHNSFYHRGLPWIQSIVAGFQTGPHCDECGADPYWPEGDLQAVLEKGRANKWPDVLGCGAYPLLVVSSRVLEAWDTERIGVFPTGRVTLLPPFPKGLEGTESPVYYWLDGGRMFGARMDFDASGFVDVRFCSTCGRRTDNISATYERQHSRVWPYKFVEGTWTGLNLFTTDLSPAAYFCTELVVDCAAKHQHTNFRFISAELGDGTGSKGQAYLL